MYMWLAMKLRIHEIPIFPFEKFHYFKAIVTQHSKRICKERFYADFRKKNILHKF